MVSREILNIKESATPTIMNIPGVTGIGIGKSSPEKIRVYTKSDCPNTINRIPEEINGIPVEIFVTGKLVALPLLPMQESFVLSDKYRPAPGGVSIGHRNVTAGTLGMKVYDAVTEEPLILSNNHVLAAASSVQNVRAQIGDPILQPGVYDSGVYPQDEIAKIKRFIPINELHINQVDCAVAKPNTNLDITDEILDIGIVDKFAVAGLNDIVTKTGRTTGNTTGTVVDVNATVGVNYGDFSATFENQIIISTQGFSAAGDSGSVIVNSNNHAVGLLFAGSITGTITIANKIDVVASMLGLKSDISPTQPPPTPSKTGGMFDIVPILPLALGMVHVGKYVGKRQDKKQFRR